MDFALRLGARKYKERVHAIGHKLQNVATSPLPTWAIYLRASYATISRPGGFRILILRFWQLPSPKMMIKCMQYTIGKCAKSLDLLVYVHVEFGSKWIIMMLSLPLHVPPLRLHGPHT
jgi:hypothetical protein